MRHDPGGTTNAGATYIYKLSGGTWSQKSKLILSDKAAYDEAGKYLSLSGDGKFVILGVEGNDFSVSDSGAAYIFTNTTGSTWDEKTRIKSSSPNGGDYFGTAVGLNYNGTVAVVGADGEDSPGSESGSSSVYSCN